MQHTRTITPAESQTNALIETYVTCDRCGREMAPNDLDCEHQERIAVRFRAGYNSVFGDGSLVEGDFCQHCVKELLGAWLRVTPDDPFEPEQGLAGEDRGEAKEAFQAYQLKDR